MAVCIISNKNFEISEREQQFLKRISPTFNNIHFPIPLPYISPDERARIRTLHRNEQFLFRNKSAFSNNNLISIYTPSDKIKVVSKEEWFSDSWDPLEEGRVFNPEIDFFSQYYDLQCAIPRASTVTMSNENCEYTTGTGFCRDCYLINSSENCDNCAYSKLLQSCKDVFDSSYIYDSELMYECFNVRKGYDCKWVLNSQNTVECWFCDDLRNCKNCFLCTNLKNKQYCLRNQQLSKEEYNNKIKLLLGNRTKLQEVKVEFEKIRSERIYRYAQILNAENCTGDFIQNSRNCLDCYDLNDSQDCLYTQVGVEIKDCIDCSNMYIKPELSYQVLGTISTYNVHFCLYVFKSSDLWYCEQCYSCKNCFACIGLRNKEYCIFNRQYTKKSYEEEVCRIISGMQKNGEWGQYFPAWMSPFSYNKSLAQEYFPLKKEEILSLKLRWQEDSNNTYHRQTYSIPENIESTPDEICQQTLACVLTGQNYRIQKNELAFYRKMGLPIPTNCPDVRYQQRLELRNPRKTWNRSCTNCNGDIFSTFSPLRSEKVYCESCYLHTIDQ